MPCTAQSSSHVICGALVAGQMWCSTTTRSIWMATWRLRWETTTSPAQPMEARPKWNTHSATRRPKMERFAFSSTIHRCPSTLRHLRRRQLWSMRGQTIRALLARFARASQGPEKFWQLTTGWFGPQCPNFDHSPRSVPEPRTLFESEWPIFCIFCGSFCHSLLLIWAVTLRGIYLLYTGINCNSRIAPIKCLSMWETPNTPSLPTCKDSKKQSFRFFGASPRAWSLKERLGDAVELLLLCVLSAFAFKWN